MRCDPHVCRVASVFHRTQRTILIAESLSSCLNGSSLNKKKNNLFLFLTFALNPHYWREVAVFVTTVVTLDGRISRWMCVSRLKFQRPSCIAIVIIDKRWAV